MNPTLQKRLIRIAKELVEVPDSRNKHFSFLVKKNNIVSIGWNTNKKTHPICLRLSFPYGQIHSEIACTCLNFRRKDIALSDCELYNVRVNVFGEIGQSHPCEICEKALKNMGIKRI